MPTNQDEDGTKHEDTPSYTYEKYWQLRDVRDEICVFMQDKWQYGKRLAHVLVLACISSMGQKAFRVLRNLVAPDRPTNVSFKNLVQAINQPFLSSAV